MAKSADPETSESIEVTTTPQKSNKSDLLAGLGSVITNTNYKVAFLLFIIGMIVFSDIFIEGVLSKIPDTVDGECPTTKGTIVQLICLTVSYLVIDLVTKYDIL